MGVLTLSHEELDRYCQAWQVAELSLFGSVLRDDVGPASDVDVLISFRPGAPWSLFDLVDMRAELSAIFGRPVDLLTTTSLRNPFRRQEIMLTRRIIYDAIVKVVTTRLMASFSSEIRPFVRRFSTFYGAVIDERAA